MLHRQGDRADAQLLPDNVGERLRTVAAVPLIENREIRGKLPEALTRPGIRGCSILCLANVHAAAEFRVERWRHDLPAFTGLI